MNIGKLDRLITIERPTITKDEMGGSLTSWATLCSLWAEYLPDKGGESAESDEMVGAEAATFRFHYYAGIKQTDRIKFNNKYWNIKSVRETVRGSKMEIDATLKDNI